MKGLLSFIFLVFLADSSLYAAAYKGQNEFVKQCVKCHRGGQDFVSSKSTAEWKRIVGKSGEELANLHINSTDNKAAASIEYFNSTRYSKNVKHLRDFLMEYSKDSGRVPACN